MRAFVIRCFDEKASVVFTRTHTGLIEPALQQVGIDGVTTGAITEAGNIPENRFRKPVLADVVVADVSVRNANGHELGVGHAVRNRGTVIRTRIEDVLFDRPIDRHLSYEQGSLDSTGLGVAPPTGEPFFVSNLLPQISFLHLVQVTDNTPSARARRSRTMFAGHEPSRSFQPCPRT